MSLPHISEHPGGSKAYKEQDDDVCLRRNAAREEAQTAAREAYEKASAPSAHIFCARTLKTLARTRLIRGPEAKVELRSTPECKEAIERRNAAASLASNTRKETYHAARRDFSVPAYIRCNRREDHQVKKESNATPDDATIQLALEKLNIKKGDPMMAKAIEMIKEAIRKGETQTFHVKWKDMRSEEDDEWNPEEMHVD